MVFCLSERSVISHIWWPNVMQKYQFYKRLALTSLLLLINCRFRCITFESTFFQSEFKIDCSPWSMHTYKRHFKNGPSNIKINFRALCYGNFQAKSLHEDSCNRIACQLHLLPFVASCDLRSKSNSSWPLLLDEVCLKAGNQVEKLHYFFLNFHTVTPPLFSSYTTPVIYFFLSKLIIVALGSIAFKDAYRFTENVIWWRRF